MTGTRFDLEVQPVLPKVLARLEELANDLVYSWNRPIRTLFAHLDRDLWHACGHNLKIFLRRVAQDKLEAAANNLVYLQDYRSVLSDYDTYSAGRRCNRNGLPPITLPRRLSWHNGSNGSASAGPRCVCSYSTNPKRASGRESNSGSAPLFI